MASESVHTFYYVFYVFFQNPKHDFLTFLSSCARFLERSSGELERRHRAVDGDGPSL